MIFVDASAIVALIADEPEAGALSSRLAGATQRATSAMAIYEAALALARIGGISVSVSLGLVEDWINHWDIEVQAIGAVQGRLAIDAYARYGRTNHKAALNMGDCFAYACAKLSGAEMLYKGEDFALTDLA